jgi:hypothetical protein
VCVCVIKIHFLLWKAVNMEVLDSTRNEDATVSRAGHLKGHCPNDKKPDK